MSTLDTKIYSPSITNYNKLRTQIFHSKEDFKLVISKNKKLKTQFLENQIKLIFKNKKINILQLISLEYPSLFNFLFEVKTNKGFFVIKILKEEYELDNSSFYLEKFGQDFLKKHDLPSLKVLEMNLNKSDYGFKYLIIEKAKGKSLSNLYPNINISTYKNLGKIFSKINKTKAHGFGPLDIKILLVDKKIVGVHRKWEDYIFLNLNNHLYICKKNKLINSEELYKIKKLFNENKKLFNIDRAYLLHNDPSFNNIYSYGKSITILDWEDAIAGDPDFELAFIHTFFYKDLDKFKIFMNGYGLSPNHFEGNKKYWLYFLRISLFKEVARYESGKKISNKRIQYALTNLSEI